MTYSRFTMAFALLFIWAAPGAHAQSTMGFTQLDIERMLCGVTADQRVVCSTLSFEKRFETPEDLPPATSVATGNSFACALLTDGQIECWGDSSFGVLDSPVDGAPYQAISAGESHACAIDSNDAIVCWGNEDNDRLLAPAGSYKQITSSYTSNCAVATNGSVECWGNRAEGNLDVPEDLPPAKQVALARHTTCALLEDGSLQCWGFPIPTPPRQGPYELIALDYKFSGSEGAFCTLDLEGRVDCRFFNAFTQALILDAQNTVPNTAGFSDLAIIEDYACGINAQGEVECWGNDQGSIASIPVPTLEAMTALPAQTTGLRAEIYSENTVELFWTSPRAAFDVAGHEIIRDGEVSAFTGNLSSYVVDDLTSGIDVEFAVRQVSVEGAIGPASETITINTANNNNLGGGDGDGYQSAIRPFEPANLTALVYSPNTLELLWDRPNRSFEVQGYEIRRNGNLIAFTRGVSFFDEVPSTDKVYRYDVIAIANGPDANILGISSVDVAVGSADLGQCR